MPKLHDSGDTAPNLSSVKLLQPHQPQVYNPSSVEINREEGITMRFMFKISFPVEAGNEAAKKDGFKAIQSILEQQKPEAAYFVAENGKRTGILIINMQDAAEIPAIAEPWFLALNAAIEVTPAMVPADLQKASSAIAQAVKTYG